jgi:hypothetical protein
MDKLDEQILGEEQKCADLRHQLEVAEIKLKALKLAAELRPSRPSTGNGAAHAVVASSTGGGVGVDSPPRRRTKRAWALSAPYRRLVQEIIAKGNPLMDSTDLADLGKTVGINLSPKEMGSRFNRYSKTGMAERSGYRYQLTELAVRAFSDPANEPPANVRWRHLGKGSA